MPTLRTTLVTEIPGFVTDDLRRSLAAELHAADCGCTDYGDPLTDEDTRYIEAVDAALAQTRVSVTA